MIFGQLLFIPIRQVKNLLQSNFLNGESYLKQFDSVFVQVKLETLVPYCKERSVSAYHQGQFLQQHFDLIHPPLSPTTMA